MDGEYCATSNYSDDGQFGKDNSGKVIKKVGDFMSTIAVHVDDKLKAEAVELFDSLGLDMTTAIKMFLIQSVQTKSIPFSVKQNISDKDFQEMVEKKIPSVKVSAGDKESLAAFFGDEDFSEYEDVFNG